MKQFRRPLPLRAGPAVPGRRSLFASRFGGYEFDEACPNRTIIVDSRVQAVVARERPLHWAKKLPLGTRGDGFV